MPLMEGIAALISLTSTSRLDYYEAAVVTATLDWTLIEIRKSGQVNNYLVVLYNIMMIICYF